MINNFLRNINRLCRTPQNNKRLKSRNDNNVFPILLQFYTLFFVIRDYIDKMANVLHLLKKKKNALLKIYTTVSHFSNCRKNVIHLYTAKKLNYNLQYTVLIRYIVHPVQIIRKHMFDFDFVPYTEHHITATRQT